MNILFLGDVVARSGREAVLNELDSIRQKYQIDFTIVNAENAAHGKGITRRIYNTFKDAGVDVMTLGNHAFAKGEMALDIDHCPDLIRPVNMEPFRPGQPYVIKQFGDKKIAVLNVLGEVFMNVSTDDPIHASMEMLDEIDADIKIVDIHAEATSEKCLFFRYMADKVTAVIGTHTHIQTADERVYKGCAYITDVGMCGAFESVLGRNINEVINRTVNGAATRYTPAEGPAVICGVVIRVDDETNRAVGIERIQIRP